MQSLFRLVEEHKALAEVFSPPLAGLLQPVAARCRYADREVIFEENAPSDSLYVLLAGQVEIAKRGIGEGYRTISLIQPGGFFGELGVIDGSGRSARARALGAVETLRLRREDFVVAIEQGPVATAIEFFAKVVGKLRATDERYVLETVRREKLSVVGEMANKVIHDFKGPFTALALGVEMIQRQHRDAFTQRYCAVMNRNLALMQSMMQEILDFTAGEARLVRTSVSLDEIFANLAEDNRLWLEQREVRLETEGAGLRIHADAGKIQRVFQNLLINSVEAFNRGTGSAVGLSARAEGQVAVVTFRDDGPGVPDAVRHLLFEPFVSEGKLGGTGLGLSIAKGIVEAHGGTITLASEGAAGAAFAIRLPLAAAPVGVAHSSRASAAGS